MKNVQGLRRVALFDPATGDRVLLKLLSPDSEVNKEQIQTEVADGAVSGGHTHTAEIVFFDLPEGARDQLIAWEQNDVEINMTGVTGTGALLWYHPTNIYGFVDSLATNARDGVSPYRVEMIAVGHDLDIYYGINFFRAAIKRGDDGRTQYDPTVSFSPLRKEIGGDFKLGGPGSLTGTELTTLAEEDNIVKFAFPIDLPFNVIISTDQAPQQITVAQQNFAGTTVASDTVDADKSVHVITPDANLYNLVFDFGSDPTSVNFFTITAGFGVDDWTNQ